MDVHPTRPIQLIHRTLAYNPSHPRHLHEATEEGEVLGPSNSEAGRNEAGKEKVIWLLMPILGSLNICHVFRHLHYLMELR